MRKLFFFSFCRVERWSSERWSNFPEDTQPVSHRVRIQTQVLVFMPSPSLASCSAECGGGHRLFWASALLRVWGSLSSPERSVISCILWLLVWEYSSWTCVIYLRIFKAVSCLGNKYFCKYEQKIGFAYPEVGRAPGISGKDVETNMYVQKRSRFSSSTPR